VVVVALVVLVALAAGAYFLLSAPPQPAKTNTTGSSSTTSPATSTSTISTSSTASTSSSTTPSSSTTSTTQQSSSVTTTQSSSCYVETTSNSSVGQVLVGFFGAYSSMSFGFQGTKDGVQKNLNLSYAVASVNSTTYKVNIDYTLNGKSKSGAVWILNNGTVVAGELNGKNYTGPTVSEFVLNAFADLDAIYSLALQSSTIPAFFHSTGTSNVTLGTSQVMVTDFVANTTPETILGCDGSSAVVDAYSVSLGTPNGSTLEMVTSANFSVTLTTSSGTETLDYQYQLTAIAAA